MTTPPIPASADDVAVPADGAATAVSAERVADADAAGSASAETAYLIDVYGLLFQCFHGIPPMTSPAGQPTNAIFGFARDLLYLLRDHKPDYLICAMDGSGHGVRRDWYAEYKTNRPDMPSDLKPQIPLLREMFEAFGLPTVDHAGWEADDVICTLTRQLVERGRNVCIVTNDKDARQLIGPRVRLFNIRKNSYLGEAELLEDWGVRPDQVVDFQALVGDAVDNVPGVPLVGPKKASQLLQQFGNLEGVLANADAAPGAKLRENLKTYAEQARLSQRLVCLACDLPLELDWDSIRQKKPDIPAVQEFFRRMGFRRLITDVEALAPKPVAVPLPDVVKGEVGKAVAKPNPTRSLFGDEEDGEAGADDSSLKAMAREWGTVDTPEAFEKLIANLAAQTRYSIDLETSDLDPIRADIVGWSVSWEPGRAWYVPVRGPAGSTLLDPDVVAAGFKKVLENPSAEWLNQNLKFDLIALQKIGINPAQLGLDTMVGDYLLDAGARSHNLEALAHKYLQVKVIPITDLIGKGKNQKSMIEIPVAKVAEYATEDSDLVMRIAEPIEKQLKDEGLWDLYWHMERPLIPVLARMEATGIRINPDDLKEQSAAVSEKLLELVGEIHDIAGHTFNIDSPLQLRKVLFDELKLPVKKRTKTGPSTDVEVLEELAELHQLPAKIMEHRHLSKLKGTYIDALPELINPVTGRVHCNFNQVVAATGRLSSSDPNLQNIPIRTPEGSRIRRAFVPQDENWRLVCADYSQIELRMLAHYSQDEVLLKAFAEGVDIHKAVAADVFRVPLDEVTSEMRRVAKAVNFGVIYGQSSFGLAAKLGIPREEAQKYIDEYFARYAGVTEFMEQVLDDCLRTGYATTISGRRRPIEGIRPPQERNRNRNMAERTGINAVIQGSAADMIKLAMIAIHHRLENEKHPARLLLQIHDELVFETPVEELDSLSKLVREEMEGALKLSVPFDVDISSGRNWLEAE